MEDLDLQRATILRQHCSQEVTVNALNPAIWAAMLAANSSLPDWRMMVQQAPKRAGGEIVGMLQKGDQIKLVGFWSDDGAIAQPDYRRLADAVVLKVWRSIYDADSFLPWCWLLALSMWILLLVYVPPVLEGFKEFRDTPAYQGYWWYFVIIVYVLSVYLVAYISCWFRVSFRLGINEDLFLVEQFRWSAQEAKAKQPNVLRGWFSWIPWRSAR